jgi:flagellar basal body L-ring protein FlgH
MRKLSLLTILLFCSCFIIQKEGQFDIYNPHEEAYYLKIHQGNEVVIEESLSDSSLNEAILLTPGESYLFKLKRPYKDSDRLMIYTFSTKMNKDNEYELIKSTRVTVKFMRKSFWTDWEL